MDFDFESNPAALAAPAVADRFGVFVQGSGSFGAVESLGGLNWEGKQKAAGAVLADT